MEYNKHIYHKFSTVLESALTPTHELLSEKQGLGSNSLLIFPKLHRKGDALVKEVRSTICIYHVAENGTISPPFCF